MASPATGGRAQARPSTGGSDSSCTEDMGPSSAGTPGGRSAESPSPSPLCPAVPWGGTRGGAVTQGSKPCPCLLSPGAWMSGQVVPKALRAGGMTWRLGGNMGNGEQCQRYHRRSPACAVRPATQSRAVPGLPAARPKLALPASPGRWPGVSRASPFCCTTAPMPPSLWFEVLNHN